MVNARLVAVFPDSGLTTDLRFTFDGYTKEWRILLESNRRVVGLETWTHTGELDESHFIQIRRYLDKAQFSEYTRDVLRIADAFNAL